MGYNTENKVMNNNNKIPDGKGGYKEVKGINSGCAIKLFALLLLLGFILYKGCSSCLDESRKQYDDEYWRSVQQEKTLRESGMDKAADRVKKERQNRLRGKDGSPTYNGSEQQKKDLEMIDEYAKKHPDF